jgi:hypothetical protein
MQITAELDDSYAEKFDQLLRIKGLSQMQQLKEALDYYFLEELADVKVQSQKIEKKQEITDNKGTLHDLLASDFVGCGEGPEDGSVNYKKYISEYLDEKYANHS